MSADRIYIALIHRGYPQDIANMLIRDWIEKGLIKLN